IILDLLPRRPFERDELLAARSCHVTPPWRLLLFLLQPRQLLEVRETVWNEILHDFHERLRHQSLGTANEERGGIARLVPLQKVADQIQGALRLVARPDVRAAK